MGVYLNSKRSGAIFRKMRESTYFVDKTAMLLELLTIVGSDSDHIDQAGGKDIRYVCITRPRRFGKTVAASMIASFFGKSENTENVFRNLAVSKDQNAARHLNKHNVIHIMFNEIPKNCHSYEQYIDKIERRLLHDLRMAYPNVEIDENDAVWYALNDIYEAEDSAEFIFVLDEWDYIYHQDFATDKDKRAFTRFLSALLKDQPYVEMVYMTGILPIAKYSSGSELNMFCEYTMATEEKYSDFFGFTNMEVDALYAKYLEKKGERVYNPRSVVLALVNNNLGNYWTSSGPYDELFYYIGANVDDVKNDIGLMVADIPIPANVHEYAAASMELNTKDEIFSAMVVYGFLNYEDGYVSIPNKELMDKFADLVQKEPSLGNVYRLTTESGRMLAATRAGDTDTMTEILEFVHNTESPALLYNNEAELASIIRLVYLKARDFYRIEREDKAGVGFVDYIFYPYRRDDDAVIIELKVNQTAADAIQQIKDRRYALRFDAKLGEKPEYTGRVLAVGIAYNKDDAKKRHECRVEVLRERL